MHRFLTRLQPNASIVTAMLLATLLAGCTTESNSSSPPALKSAYQKYFYVGVAINRDIAPGTAAPANNVSRTQEQVDKDIALVKEQFDQISPENDLKWSLVQPQAGPDGYDFGPADAYVKFGIENHMYIVGHN